MTKKLPHILIFWLLFAAEAVCFAQTATTQTAINDYFLRFDLGFTLKGLTCHLDELKTDNARRTIDVFASEAFGMQSFNEEKVKRIYSEVLQLLPEAQRSYDLRIYAKGILIDELVIGGSAKGKAPRTWGDIRHRGNPWVTPLSRPWKAERGLEGRHISLWASHGRYFSQTDDQWQWQRPRLFSTTEDLLSQTIVVPFLMPMLENAGAILFSPRERDWQKHEVIVDNDRPATDGTYSETEGQHSWADGPTGFAHLKDLYLDGENPFTHGTVRTIPTQQRRSSETTATWTPIIPEDGPYAVYVSYATLPTSVSDATYTVHHRGQVTRFRVNQQMGGGTWVYLGTFDFAAGESSDNCVTLSNQSNYRGHITADAVRFGGGMGNIVRGDTANLRTSRLPRFLEGARYSAQWAGFPYATYASKGSTNDYAEDINVRSHTSNYLARGSAYLPGDSGLCVPLELSIALHTDAGYTRDQSIIGSLGISTTDFNDGLLPAGLSRLTSRDVCDIVLSQVTSDLDSITRHWTRRQMYDRNYSETREPAVPAIILEMLSHQNFADLRLAHDPYFKFLLARSIYKGILRSICQLHDKEKPVVQPMPPTAPMAMVTPGSRDVEVTWLAVDDPLEPTAMPSYFIVYHAEGDGGFDNGTLVADGHYLLRNATPATLHRFYVTAANDGGQSMPSPEVCAYIGPDGAPHALVIDAFNRLAGPQPIASDSTESFDMRTDFGVPMARMPGYCGQQICWDKKGYGREGYGALGHSTAELEGMIVAGNTFDWTTRHARDIVAATLGQLTISSCTSDAATRTVFDSRSFDLIDLAYGLNRDDGYSLRPSPVFQPAMVQSVASFTRSGGRLLVSGAYIGSDMQTDDERLFTRSVLRYEYAGTLPSDSIADITGLNTNFSISVVPNEQQYTVSSANSLAPVEGSFCAMVYDHSGQSAATAYAGTDYKCFAIGFPFEAITDVDKRRQLMSGIIRFLLY
ncbi:MAG: hypothetical protein IJ209_09440 [Bacteroidaceae bacterium]|nr:hypothetical protein [Bacteroidaceae bacterium]